MIGSFLTRGLVMILGYAYPAYECYKTVEKNKPDVEQLRFWCQYWILVAMLTVTERVGDTFVSWVPMYSEAKLFFFIYLWYPKTKGTTYVYDSFFRPYIAKHEMDIDRNLLELKTRAGDYAILYWQRAASYSQTRVFDILQYIASQSTPRPRPAQTQQASRVRQPTAAQNRQAAATALKQVDEPASTASTSGESQVKMVEKKNPSELPASSAPLVTAINEQKLTATQSIDSSSKPATSNEEVLANDTASSSAKEDANPPPADIVMEESIRVTRGRLRRARVTSIR
ncbi:hypothetical protein DCAR_0520070 [Daucus carota subsp. sativus]|uniref:HVA22-like protein n=1 Tax=Daucus carota subsp. sativus TaxID=79200 RepID=A0AAF1B245_DAUCS|nr:PREDICTED: putative HVA22-like protein g [Daucus carota subsp. sativus]WOH00696.1 hypothetical protein DCAR_0520070 [Daucus carota subsp. sativus]